MIETILVLLLVAIAVVFSYRRGEAAGRVQGLTMGQIIGELAITAAQREQQLVEDLEQGRITEAEFDERVCDLVMEQLEQLRHNIDDH